MSESTASPASWVQKWIKHQEQNGKILNLAQLHAVRDMQRAAEEQAKNREAESAHVRRTVWGEQEQTEGPDEVGHTILGDIQQSPPIVVSGGGNVGWLAPALLGLAIPTAGLAGAAAAYLATRQPPDDAGVITDETVSIGLGRLEDYLREASE